MTFDEYQKSAFETDQFRAKKADTDMLIPLLGLAGETGTLLAEFKKKIRDKETYDGFDDRAEEELGDVLWYLSDIATRLNLSLSTIASKNLNKTHERWPTLNKRGATSYYDADRPPAERLPIRLEIKIFETTPDREARIQNLTTGDFIGDPLTDNAYDDDGYRFHDVLHFANMAVLGWSPVMRKLLGKKRKSDRHLDEIEDGARAALIEELIIAYAYSNARERNFHKGSCFLDSEMLATIKRLVAGFEVRTRTTSDWEKAIIQGYEAFRKLLIHKEGKFIVDMESRRLITL